MKRDLGYISITARQLADHAVGLAMNLAIGNDDRTGVYCDAARYDITLIEADLAQIKAVLANAPTMNRGAA